MALGNLFKLARLTIEAHQDLERSKPITGGNVLAVMYNPETLAIRHENVLQNRPGVASQGASARWSHGRSKELSVKLVFDGTEVGRASLRRLVHVPTVAAWVKAFLTLCCDVQSESHEPPYLRLKWSTGVFGLDGFECRLQSVDIQYTAFARDGSPLRAELTARFIEAVDPKKKSAQLRLSSPDLTHVRVVRDGDTLPLLCREIYGSADHYICVARVNGLDDFRDLMVGQELIFPPFARTERD